MDVVLDINFKGRDQFDEEIVESMRTCLEAEEWNSPEQQNKLIVEINSSKISYNIALEHLTKTVFSAFMQQEKFGPTLEDMRKVRIDTHAENAFSVECVLLVCKRMVYALGEMVQNDRKPNSASACHRRARRQNVRLGEIRAKVHHVFAHGR